MKYQENVWDKICETARTLKIAIANLQRYP